MMKITIKNWKTKTGEKTKVSERSMEPQFNHEKLHVYQQGLRFVAWAASVLVEIDRKAAVLDHLDRAAAGVVESIANGNSRRSASDRNRYFDVALGSGLECAACLDICARKGLIPVDAQTEGKRMLQPIVRMIVGLRKVDQAAVREDGESYATDETERPAHLFFHEELDVYQRGLDAVSWLDCFLREAALSTHRAAGLDAATTSLVLNIAEGNGRYSSTDHRRFLDIAHTCAINAAATLDLLVAKKCVTAVQINEGKRILAGVVPMLFGLRGYLDDQES